MTQTFRTIYRKVFFRGIRVFALLLLIASLSGSIVIATNSDSRVDTGLKWGLVALMILLSVVSACMLRAPTNRQ